jgi:hypothetical protein
LVLSPDNQNQVLGKVVSIIRDIWCHSIDPH